MKILKIQSENPEEFYSSHGDDFMSELIKQLRKAEPSDLEVFCLTSVYQLCLLNKSAYDSTKYLTIDSDRKGAFEIDYLLPEEQRPNSWTHYKKSRANSIDQALKSISEGMKLSKGWLF